MHARRGSFMHGDKRPRDTAPKLLYLLEYLKQLLPQNR